MRTNGPISVVEDYQHKWRFLLVAFNDIKLGKAPRYLVMAWIPRQGIVVVWGPPKCGKSFWIFDLTMHVALGWDYRGRRVEQGIVVYIALEGEHGFAARIEAFRQRKLAESGDAHPLFYLLATRLDLAKEAEELATEIAAQLGSNPCAVIVIDTLNRSLVGSESRDEDMAAYIRGADLLREKFHCAVVIIHHCGVNDKRPRGHTSLAGAADAQIAVRRDALGNVIAEVEYMKDGPAGEITVSRLVPLDVDCDEDGEAITSCAVEEADSAPRQQRQKPLAPAQRRARELLISAIGTAGKIPPENNHIPTNVRCVTESLWRDYCYHGAISDSDNQDAKQKAFKRAARKLVASGHVGKWGDMVWIIQS